MQFSQHIELQSFKQPFVEAYSQQKHFAIDISQAERLQPASEEFYTILDQIQQINQSRSMFFSLMQECGQQDKNIIDIEQLPSAAGSTDPHNEKDDDYQVAFSTPLNIVAVSHRKSNIFVSNSKSFYEKSSIVQNKANHIKIYYFGQPTCKILQYHPNTTIDMMVSLALNSYIIDLGLDQTFIKSTDHKKYELRFPENQDSCKPDYHVESIARDRLIADSLFQVLVLVLKQKSQRKKSYAENKNKINQILTDEISLSKQGQIKLHIFNQANIIVASLILSKDDTLQKALQYLQNQFQEKIILTETIQDQTPLPSDIEARNLTSYKLYVKKKKYLDEPEKQKVPLKIISSIPKDLSPKVMAPIGITEASRYEEFEVVKINSRGIQQPRILGIDQNKVYNYDASLRKNKKQASFFSKLIGNSAITGTKKPQRLISEILQANSLLGYSFQIVFPQKKLFFTTDSQETKQKILRKLKFLIQYNKSESNIKN